ncbi:hypothetical protein [Lutimonas zeaxanthinifaciens]|uniref:hypothetical protein n=1 Tax=Lutimonas zeaxanthinifaciens TaxID=3060215 RepID=UPI00265D45E5|nr:hypothetical protein [Lutimonas sp. YSD2104]WKK66260.1 hypothetical protein QZH61_01250 [Lutimonas sp. YSD2104]
MNGINKNHFIVGVLSVIAGFIAKTIYRPYVYEYQINDFGLADGAPSFFYVIGFSQLLLVKKFRYPWLVILVIVTGSLAFEFWQMRNRPLDLIDTGMSILGGICSFLLWQQIKNKK